MNQVRKLWKWVVLLVVVFVAAQLSVSFGVRTKRMHGYLVARVEWAFGRPVQVSGFSAQILPIPRLEMNGVTIGEDPAFGNEYFLRAESMQASLRWMGLLKGKFEFGTMSLTRPSLILVRNKGGRWNLEGWLPRSAGKVGGAGTSIGPQIAASPSNYLQKIEFDDGRISFKVENEKRPFAFTNVSGNVEQTGPGRWQLNLEAKPWRSGVALQSAGILYVRGNVAGTSARLQPAQVQVHWDRVSLADLFRLVTGNDYGVRGEFALDGTASVGAAEDGKASPVAGRWKYELKARATQVHRWDLTDRNDNPSVSAGVKGYWDLASDEIRTEELSVDLPQSNLRGEGTFGTTANSAWSMRVDSASLGARDILAWYRAFQPNVMEGLSAEQYFSGKGLVRGWPLRWEEGQLSSEGGVLRAPGLIEPVRIGRVRGGVRGNSFVIDPARVSLSSAKTAVAAEGKTEKPGAKARETQNWAELRFVHDTVNQSGWIGADGHLDQVELFFKLAAAFGKIVNRGWELGGGVRSDVQWEWKEGMFRNGRWNGSMEFEKAEIQAAGLNQPIELEEARLEWKMGQRSATITKANAFGAAWSGTATEGAARTSEERGLPRWQFRLHADHLDATELDRWVGPRARPNWLQRLLPSLLGNTNVGGKPSELLRRISAEGELSAEAVTVEKIKLSDAYAKLSLENLELNVREAEAQWVGGNVRGTMRAEFSSTPKYEIAAQMERVNLAELPWIPGWAERWNGLASGRVQLTTAGVGRDELLKQLAGRGEIQAKNVEFRGWDVANSLESGAAKAGISRWESGGGEFQVKDRGVSFDAIKLEGPHAKVQVSGSLGFGKEVELTFRGAAGEARGAARGAEVRVLHVSGPGETPRGEMETVSTVKVKQ
ncbi:MAG TPA: AsmA family protein [Candidatus Acidoferrum sp.]